MANTQTTVPTFIPGQVLEASQLVNSAATGVPVFATTVTRDAGFGGAGEKALAEGQLCYLESTNVVQYYDGAAWATLAPASSAAVVQVKSTTLTSTFSGVASLGTFLDITGLTISITPTSASNKIMVFAEVAASTASGVGTVTAILTGGNCASYRGDADQTRQRAAVSQTYPLDRAPCTLNLLYLDSPATTSATVYGVGLNYGNNSGATDTVYCNRGYTDTNNTYTVRTASTITVMEVAP